jgi:hypothetical protein
MRSAICSDEWSRSAFVVLAGPENVNAKQFREALFEELVPLFAPLGNLPIDDGSSGSALRWRRCSARCQ